MARRSRIFDQGLSAQMEDTIVVGSFKSNRDGSITISCQISVIDHETHECWMIESKVIRLPKQR